MTGIGATSRYVAKFEGRTLPQAEFSIHHSTPDGSIKVTALKWTLANASNWPTVIGHEEPVRSVMACKMRGSANDRFGESWRAATGRERELAPANSGHSAVSWLGDVQPTTPEDRSSLDTGHCRGRAAW